MNQESKAFQDLMAEMGLSKLSEDKQNELIIKMTEVILKRIFVETMNRLKPADQDEYGEMLDRGASPEEIEKFLRDKIADYEQVLEKIVVNFKQEMIDEKEKTK